MTTASEDKKKDDVVKFSGKPESWDFVTGKERQYLIGAIKYGKLRKAAQSYQYSAITGKGEQRPNNPGQVKKLQNAISDGSFSPDPVTIGTYENHRKAISKNDDMVNLEIDPKNKLPLINGDHRFSALEKIRTEGGETEKRIDNLRIPYLLYLDGDNQRDFVNLNFNLPVNRDHLTSLRVEKNLIEPKHAAVFKMAKQVAMLLHENPNSPFFKMIGFGKKNLLSLNAMLSKSAREIGFSLVGICKIAIIFKKDVDWVANLIQSTYEQIANDSEACLALDPDNLMEMVPEGNTTGNALLIGVSACMADRLMLQNEDEPSENDFSIMLGAVINNFIIPSKGNTSSPYKQKLFGDFARDFFEDILMNTVQDDSDEDESIDVPANPIVGHEGIPIQIMNILSPSTFGASKLPAAPKKKGRKPKAEKTPKEEKAAAIRKKKPNLKEIKLTEAVQLDPDSPIEYNDIEPRDLHDNGDWSEEDRKAKEVQEKLSVDEDSEMPWDDQDLEK